MWFSYNSINLQNEPIIVPSMLYAIEQIYVIRLQIEPWHVLALLLDCGSEMTASESCWPLKYEEARLRSG